MIPIKTAAALAAVALWLAPSASAGAATADAQAITATVGRYFASIDKGDIAAAQAMQTVDAAITDEFPPYHWGGPDSLQVWFKDFGPYAQAGSISEPGLNLDTAPRIEIKGDHAYAVYA